VAGHVSLSIYDATGRRMRTLLEDELRPGVHIVVWDGRDGAGRTCAGGVYFAALRQAGDAKVARLLLLR
jgi:flagellar hook assembly protein FlgD